MKDDVPRYVAPQPDPGLAILTAQNDQQNQAAIQDRVSAASAALMTRYGTRTAMAGGPGGSPLLAPMTAAPAVGG